MHSQAWHYIQIRGQLQPPNLSRDQTPAVKQQPVTFLQWLHSSSTSTVMLCHGIWTHNMQNLLDKLSNVSNVNSVNWSALITIWYVNGFTTINIIPGNFQRYTPPLYYLAWQCDCCQLQHAQHDMQIWPKLGHHVEGGHQCPTGHMCCCQKSLLRHSEAAARCDASHRLSAPHNSRQAGALLQEGVMSHGSHLSPHHYFQLVPQLDNREWDNSMCLHCSSHCHNKATHQVQQTTLYSDTFVVSYNTHDYCHFSVTEKHKTILTSLITSHTALLWQQRPCQEESDDVTITHLSSCR